MKRRALLAHLGGAIGMVLTGCSEGNEDNGARSDTSTVEVPTAQDIPTVPDQENVTVENVTIETPSIENVTVEMPTIEDPTGNATAPDVSFCPDHDDIDVVNHSLARTTDEEYYVEGTVRNKGTDSVCSYVVLEIEYPDDRRETDSLFMGDLDPDETGYFILGPIDLSDADPDSVGYNIYVTNESWDDD